MRGDVNQREKQDPETIGAAPFRGHLVSGNPEGMG